MFVTWKGDHFPRHVHIYKDHKLLGKWNLEDQKLIEGKINRKIQTLILTLVEEGKL